MSYNVGSNNEDNLSFEMSSLIKNAKKHDKRGHKTLK